MGILGETEKYQRELYWVNGKPSVKTEPFLCNQLTILTNISTNKSATNAFMDTHTDAAGVGNRTSLLITLCPKQYL